MAQCVKTVNGYLMQDDTGVCENILLTAQEYQAFQTDNLLTVLDSYFAFDQAVFGEYLGYCLVTFIGSFAAGTIVKYLSK